jgi:hypothetical protein
MLQMPLSAVPSQTFAITLAGQNCQLAVYQKTTGIYMDLTVNGKPITTAVRCVEGARLLLDRQYLGFIGDFGVIDTQGNSDPVYTGLGSRWQLLYLEASDLAAG